KLTFETIQLAVTLSDSLNQDYQSEGTQKIFQEKNRELYEMAISTAFDLYEATGNREVLYQAFEWTEKSKSALLTAHIRQNEALLYAGVDTAMQKELFEVNRWRTFYANQINLAKQEESSIDSERLTYWKNQKFDFNQKYDSLKRELQQRYPQYYQLAYDYGVVSIAEIQNELIPDQAIIEYFSGEGEWFLFAITRDSFAVYREEKGSLDAEISDVLLYIRDSGSDIKGFYHKSRGLYKTLLYPITKLIENHHLIIIPDGFLNKLPFEILLSQDTEKRDWYSLPYLIRDFQIAYGYSSTLWWQSDKWRDEPRLQRIVPDAKKFLGYAPKTDLEHTRKEVHQVATLMRGKTRLGEGASKKHFLKEASRYGIIHLATHAYINDTLPLESRLIFSMNESNNSQARSLFDHAKHPDDLYAWELYNLNLKAQMVVLSACESGTGYLQRAEGVMSLGRAFSYAGVPSIIASLWKVGDKSTSEMMVSFYQNLLLGKTKDESLRNAKMDYLKEHPSEAHPYYWAPFIVMGDAGALISLSIFPTEFWWTILILIILGIGVGFGILKFRTFIQ
ncbi:MAG: CHAT domain-containing protein, partial [Bacteroidetes bacterium]|nr:CHAT domain-containing protein [Bacteroidota bacterium]